MPNDELDHLPASQLSPYGFKSMGLRIASRGFDEATALRLAHTYEAHTGWHAKRPPL